MSAVVSSFDARYADDVFLSHTDAQSGELRQFVSYVKQALVRFPGTWRLAACIVGRNCERGMVLFLKEECGADEADLLIKSILKEAECDIRVVASEEGLESTEMMLGQGAWRRRVYDIIELTNPHE
ncbi:MAG TPA: hypothetical protein VNR89_17480 [Roseomonas sp.]|nr:hypothetical protein [Roseomonas sp.]